MNKYLLSLIFLFPFVSLSAQNLLVNGNVLVENESVEGARVVIYKNNTKLSEQEISKKGRFEFRLALDADYKILFEKDGFITKNVSVNTEVPGEIQESNPDFPPIKLIINLLPKVEQVDLSIFEQPVAILSYNQELDDFTFDKEYSDRVRDRIAQTEQMVKKQLAQKGTDALKKEREFAELVGAGQRSFEQKNWQEAIGKWSQALTLVPENGDVKNKIELAKQEEKKEKARQSIEQQNERSYKILLASADSLFNLQKYAEAKSPYAGAVRMNAQDPYPAKRLDEIDKLLAEQARQLAENQKRLGELENDYKKQLATGDGAYNNKEYEKAIAAYRDASAKKPTETYPKEMIAKAEKALTTQNRALAEEQEKKQQEEARRATLRNDYDRLIQEGDIAFKAENYALARLRYSEADTLSLGEEYPKKQLAAIEEIINSAKYKARLEEFKLNKSAADKALEENNYASAKFYYQKALSILPLNKESIDEQIKAIDQRIEAEQFAAMQKQYKEHIGKADKAYAEKAYAVAKFYYQKALDIKINDKYAKDKLQEVEKFINVRQEKEAKL